MLEKQSAMIPIRDSIQSRNYPIVRNVLIIVNVLVFLWEQEPVEVVAYGRRFLHPSLIDAAFLHLRFGDGSMAQLHVSWLSPVKVRRFFVGGTHGALSFDDTAEAKLRIIDQGVDSRIGLKDNEAVELYYL